MYECVRCSDGFTAYCQTSLIIIFLMVPLVSDFSFHFCQTSKKCRRCQWWAAGWTRLSVKVEPPWGEICHPPGLMWVFFFPPQGVVNISKQNDHSASSFFFFIFFIFVLLPQLNFPPERQNCASACLRRHLLCRSLQKQTPFIKLLSVRLNS